MDTEETKRIIRKAIEESDIPWRLGFIVFVLIVIAGELGWIISYIS